MHGEEPFILHDAVADDAEGICQLIQQSLEQSYSQLLSPEAIHYLKQYHSRKRIQISLNRDDVLLVSHVGQLVGTGTLSEDTLNRLYVHPAYQRQGIGRILLRALEEVAIKEGATVLRLTAPLPAVPFFESQGFTTSHSTFIPLQGITRLDYDEMVKRLPSPV